MVVFTRIDKKMCEGCPFFEDMRGTGSDYEMFCHRHDCDNWHTSQGTPIPAPVDIDKLPPLKSLGWGDNDNGTA